MATGAWENHWPGQNRAATYYPRQAAIYWGREDHLGACKSGLSLDHVDRELDRSGHWLKVKKKWWMQEKEKAEVKDCHPRGVHLKLKLWAWWSGKQWVRPTKVTFLLTCFHRNHPSKDLLSCHQLLNDLFEKYLKIITKWIWLVKFYNWFPNAGKKNNSKSCKTEKDIKLYGPFQVMFPGYYTHVVYINKSGRGTTTQ